MKTIHKYKLEITDEQEIELPVGSSLLHVAEQVGAGLCVWAAVDTRREMGKRRFRILGTGNPLPGGMDTFLHLGTAVMRNGLVWHVFNEV